MLLLRVQARMLLLLLLKFCYFKCGMEKNANRQTNPQKKQLLLLLYCCCYYYCRYCCLELFFFDFPSFGFCCHWFVLPSILLLLLVVLTYFNLLWQHYCFEFFVGLCTSYVCVCVCVYLRDVCVYVCLCV